jgi:hypothetical protein
MNRILTGCAALALALGMTVGDAGATTRYWQLQGAHFADGGTVVGSFAYDDGTSQISTWNLRVQGGSGHLPQTFLPGNSTATAGGVGIYGGGFVYYFEFKVNTGLGNAERVLFFSVPLILNGMTPSQALYLVDPVTSFTYSYDRRPAISERDMVAGTLNLVLLPPAVALVNVVEFHHAGLDHYFESADVAEIAGLDSGYFPGWTRTGDSFKAYVAGSSAGPTMNPVCRWYKLPVGGVSTHFYTGSAYECWLVGDLFGAEWTIESDNVFQIDLPNPVTGACPGGTIPIYRLFNGNFAAPNHRYTTSLAVRATMESMGWVREGNGPDAVIMCAVP